MLIINKERRVLGYLLQATEKKKVKLIINERTILLLYFLRFLVQSKLIYGFIIFHNNLCILIKGDRRCVISTSSHCKVSRYYMHSKLYLKSKLSREKNSYYVYKTLWGYFMARDCVSLGLGGQYLSKM